MFDTKLAIAALWENSDLVLKPFPSNANAGFETTAIVANKATNSIAMLRLITPCICTCES